MPNLSAPNAATGQRFAGATGKPRPVIAAQSFRAPPETPPDSLPNDICYCDPVNAVLDNIGNS
jgi:hypothetical protein